MDNNKKDRSGAIGCITGIACFVGFILLMLLIEPIVENHNEELYDRIGDSAFPAIYLIAAALISFGLIPWLFLKRARDSATNGVNGSEQATQKKNIGPSSDILEIIRQYKELDIVITPDNRFEYNRRCNEMIIEFEWYSDLTHRRPDNQEMSSANWHALWDAMCSHDVVYSGDKYPRGMMSDIGLKIIEKYSNRG